MFIRVIERREDFRLVRLFEEGISNEPWNKVGSFHSIAWLISDAPTVTGGHKRTNLPGYLANLRLLSKEKRNHGNSARLTREQWRGPRGSKNSRHGTMSGVLAVDWLLAPSPYLTAILFTPL